MINGIEGLNSGEMEALQVLAAQKRDVGWFLPKSDVGKAFGTGLLKVRDPTEIRSPEGSVVKCRITKKGREAAALLKLVEG